LTSPGAGPTLRVRNIPQLPGQETLMRLTFIGKDPESDPTGSPTVYRTDRGT